MKVTSEPFASPVGIHTLEHFPKIERELKAKLLVLARNENRTLSNFIEMLLKNEIARHEEKQGGRIRIEYRVFVIPEFDSRQACTRFTSRRKLICEQSWGECQQED
jgi:hypothetical protein